MSLNSKIKECCCFAASPSRVQLQCIHMIYGTFSWGIYTGVGKPEHESWDLDRKWSNRIMMRDGEIKDEYVNAYPVIRTEEFR